MVGWNGSECHSLSGPVGTTSVWPAKHTTGWPLPRRAQRLLTSPKCIGSHLKPILARRAAIRSWQPASSGVTDFFAMSSRTSSSVRPSGIHVDLDVAERGIAARSGGENAFLFLFLRRLRRGGGG